MSQAAEKVKHEMHRYVHFMNEHKREIDAIYITKRQFADLKAATHDDKKKEYKPRFLGHEVKVHHAG